MLGNLKVIFRERTNFMKNLFSAFVGFLGLFFVLVGCSQKETKELERIEMKESERLSLDEQELKTTESGSGKTDHSLIPDPLEQIKKQPGEITYLVINGSKFEAPAKTLSKGDVVTDLSMYEKAKVTGDLVVVTSDENFDIGVFKPSYKVRSIAKATFRLTPIQSSNLLLDYKKLKQLPGVKQVEVQLDYSPVDDGKATF